MTETEKQHQEILKQMKIDTWISGILAAFQIAALATVIFKLNK